MSLAFTTISLRVKCFVLKKVVARAYEQKEGKNILIDVTQRLICLKVYQNKRVNMATFQRRKVSWFGYAIDKKLTLFS